mmetsp:Transcript_96705/g.167849  ORF Transcript_96705/g.167849 Transcript_96705/m.167849 type:complete len:218 (+) Transcript_96705:328-981(+)
MLTRVNLRVALCPMPSTCEAPASSDLNVSSCSCKYRCTFARKALETPTYGTFPCLNLLSISLLQAILDAHDHRFLLGNLVLRGVRGVFHPILRWCRYFLLVLQAIINIVLPLQVWALQVPKDAFRCIRASFCVCLLRPPCERVRHAEELDLDKCLVQLACLPVCPMRGLSPLGLIASQRSAKLFKLLSLVNVCWCAAPRTSHSGILTTSRVQTETRT